MAALDRVKVLLRRILRAIIEWVEWRLIVDWVLTVLVISLVLRLLEWLRSTG